MKILLLIIVSVGSFLGGIYYENYRLLGEPETTIAVMFADTALDNIDHYQKQYIKYLELINEGKIEELKKEIIFYQKTQNEIEQYMRTICDQPEMHCKNEHIELLKK